MDPAKYEERRREMKKTILTSLLALAISVLFVSAVMAQQSPAPVQSAPAQQPKMEKAEKFRGVIEKVDPVNKDVLMQYHKEKMTFAVGDQTKVVEGKKALPFGDLKKGMWASVQYRKEGDKLLAESMSVSMPKMAAKKETSTEMKKESANEMKKEPLSEKQPVEKK